MNKYNLKKEDIINQLNYSDDIKQYLLQNTIFICRSGSWAYGTNIETSDEDFRGIFIGEPVNILGTKKIEQFECKTNDIVFYELSKALKLIAECNPNMMELLHCAESDIIFKTDVYDYIRSFNKNLISSIVKHKYSGYAMSQLHRIKGHCKWLTQEQEGKFEHKPELIDYCRMVNSQGITIRDKNILENASKHFFLTHETETIYKIWNIYNENINEKTWFGKNYEFCFLENKPQDAEFIGLLFFSHDQFDQDMKNYTNWKKWKNNRNVIRSKIEREFGLDLKHAMHLIRLLRMGNEILTTGDVLVKRPDAKELLEIRNGKWAYNQIIEYAEKMDKEVLEDAYKKTKLPHKVNIKLVDELLEYCYLNHWKKLKLI
jgi:uncharacterized protein